MDVREANPRARRERTAAEWRRRREKRVAHVVDALLLAEVPLDDELLLLELLRAH
jgi:hypothetical protein